MDGFTNYRHSLSFGASFLRVNSQYANIVVYGKLFSGLTPESFVHRRQVLFKRTFIFPEESKLVSEKN